MRHPYIGLPDQQFWKKEAGVKDWRIPDFGTQKQRLPSFRSAGV